MKKKYVYGHRGEINQFLPEKYNIVLEIGCNTGGFIKNLKAQEIWGVEPNHEAALISSKNGYKMLVGLYDEVCDQIPDNFFDLIIINDVLEHMVNEKKFLQDIKSKMKKEGVLVGSIPNVRYVGNLFKLLIKKDWKYEDQGILDMTHLRFFTEKSLIRCFKESNYTIDKFKGINSDFEKKNNVKTCLRKIVLAIVIVFSGGYFYDIQYIQFGFKIKNIN